MAFICCRRNLFSLLSKSKRRKSLLAYNHHSSVCTSSSVAQHDEYDVVVVGGGIVGMATARELKLRHPELKMAVVEKESKLAAHQSGNNSGVIHAGIYYKPGSLRAKLCVKGLHLTYKYLDKKNIPYKKCGKLIVATDPIELPALEDLYERGVQNNVPDMKVIDGSRIEEIEPHCQGVRAIHSPHTGIVDWGLVTHYFGKDFTECGGEILLNFKVVGFEEVKDPVTRNGKTYPVRVVSEKNNVVTSNVITCSGLHSDVIAKLSGCSADPRIIPFRGEYLVLKKNRRHLVKGNIYPVPDPRYPFLGVHFTPRMDGNVLVGPNAVLAFKREGYRWTDINLKELKESLEYPGFRKLAMKNIVYGSKEMLKSAFKYLQVKELQMLIPELSYSDVERGPAGVRAQAMDPSGQLIEDFVFDISGNEGDISSRILHVRNAPSPGATSSMAIAEIVADKAKDAFHL